ncbi:MAG: YceI family protein [Cytophagales bacterium]|nr:YceI family protein [Cytophagales bacterium]
MKFLLVNVLFCLFATQALTQPLYMTRNGKVFFFSKTPVENIDAVNNEVTSLLNTANGEVAVAVLVKSFHFDRALMEEHFNENYMESTKFPKATYNGKILNLDKINFKVNGTYPVEVGGDLTLHGVKQYQTATGTLTVAADKLEAAAQFTIKLADFKIQIPSLVAEKISETIEIKINCIYAPKQ